jgi:hypothetical protein
MVTEPLKPRSATPARLPDFVEPMKAKLVHSMRTGDWIYEIKFDGYRAIWPQPLGPRLDRCGNEALPLGQTGDGVPDKIHGVDAG